MRKKILFIIILFVQNIVFCQNNTIKLVSWNIRDFGQTKNIDELRQIANLLKGADIIAIQEVVAGYGGAQAVAKLNDILNRKGGKWDYVISDPTHSPAYMTERYAYIWKTKNIKIKNRGRLLKELNTEIDREPLLIDFYSNDNKFTIINFHSRPYGKDPKPEIKALTKFVADSLQTPLLLVGDFNTNENDKVFSPIKKKGFTSTIVNQKTTLKRSCQSGSYLNYVIDNIFYSKNVSKIDGGVIDFVKFCDNLEKARKLSDHLPVYLEFKISH
ncbi:endonuclease/exonuclease/phosphatase family metal-dependent hydrolase [Aquimarina sp. EL_43]|uniref:endonuclease/exonuclease/phosphatase family protein n=1 Tax=unclassified Aquimarina TaxID=2627091 RepID=UPI0018C99F1C|nr:MULTISPECIES: endonuclease/exonuclease/phosphatase family protein [unclassified Aquimarina]MBG6131747.1 endonuclease/exonuclease/phosphatase family metal-dependent hydrolase [Aquimarina sp. EL_35]MBG6149311.1 endonuclease/exonuclease/phosphatase family metal-dependent hydrolase [Aquimarina sp. EL_32]MBG6170426.1 endonuclease/exonuclease/phosphatase family metal-dependent hydrolase [Aquimarina sp. EL_43]